MSSTAANVALGALLIGSAAFSMVWGTNLRQERRARQQAEQDRRETEDR